MSAETTILIIDDVSGARRVLKKMLGKIGYSDIHEASSGEEAKAQLAKERIGLIISDLHLKDIEGLDLFIELKKDYETSKIPFILMTSDLNEAEFSKACKEGISHYMIKPFSADLLQGEISAALGLE